MKTKQRLFSLALALFVLFSLFLTACGSGKSAFDSGASMNSSSTEMARPEEAPMPQPSAASGGQAATPADLSPTTGESIAYSPDKIIYSGVAELETMDFEAALEGLEALLAESGGFIQSSSVNGTDFYSQHSGRSSLRSANYILRIPANQFSDFRESLKTLGNLPYSNVNAENISMQYSDTETRLLTAQIKEERFLELLSQATSMEDILTIENSLSDVGYEIESLTFQLKNWDSQLSYSTLNVTVREVSLYTEDNPDTLPYGQQLQETFTRSLKATGRFFKDLLKFLVAASPTLVICGVIALAVVFIVRGATKGQRQKKAAVQRPESDTPKDPK